MSMSDQEKPQGGAPAGRVFDRRDFEAEIERKRCDQMRSRVKMSSLRRRVTGSSICVRKYFRIATLSFFFKGGGRGQSRMNSFSSQQKKLRRTPNQ